MFAASPPLLHRFSPHVHRFSPHVHRFSPHVRRMFTASLLAEMIG
jgi:hypothetical protein